ncbi:MAG: PQQ-binding-like beta-propeller repeat protein, partial [Planctomycetota bacterium]
FAHSSSSILSCFDSETGRKLWATNLGGQDEPAFPPVANETTVIIASGSNLIALNKWTGDILWDFPLPISPSTAPIIDEKQAYLGTTDGSLMAFDLEQLATRFNKRLNVESAGMAIRWKYKITANIDTQPVSSGETISFAGTNRTTYTISRARDLRYTFDTPLPVSAGLATNRGLLYVCTADARVFALDVVTGALRWQTVVGAPVYETPRLIQDEMFVSPLGIGMFRLRARDGAEMWDHPAQGVDKFVGATSDSVFGSDRAMNLVRLSRKTGEIQGALPLDRFTLRIANDLTDRLYLATPTGMIIALREPGRELPLYFKFPERLPIMPEFAPEKAPEETETPTSEDKPADEKSTEEKPEATETSN